MTRAQGARGSAPNPAGAAPLRPERKTVLIRKKAKDSCALPLVGPECLARSCERNPCRNRHRWVRTDSDPERGQYGRF